jgi:hypothetical protein
MPLPPIEEDPLCGLVGAYSGSSADDIDEVVCGAKDPSAPERAPG